MKNRSLKAGGRLRQVLLYHSKDKEQHGTIRSCVVDATGATKAAMTPNM